MYKLVSKLTCFGEGEFGTFQWASDAIEHAQNVGMPGEEFDVFNSDGVRVAGLIVKDSIPASLLN
jgi:hypothetical protein